MAHHERKEAGREGSGAAPGRGVAPGVEHASEASCAEGQGQEGAETEGEAADLVVTPEMIEAGLRAIEEWIGDEDRCGMWDHYAVHDAFVQMYKLLPSRGTLENRR